MAYYYSVASQQNTNGTPNTDTLLANWHTAAAGARAYIQKLIAGTYTTPADNQVRLQLRRTTVLATAGTGITPIPLFADAPAANAVSTTLPTAGTLSAVPLVQLAYNQRGTAMWAAFNADEAIGMVGTTAPNSEVVLDSQASAASVPVTFEVIHSE